jgi:hypothetical protein
MLKRNLIVIAIMSFTLISAGAAFGQPTRQKAKPQVSRTNSRQPRNTNLTKAGAGTLNAAKNKTSQPSRTGIPRGRGIIIANTEGDIHLKGKNRQQR